MSATATIAKKLQWEQIVGEQDYEEAAYLSPMLRIRAVRDDCPSNPFEDWDGHWPMLARVGGERDSSGKYECPTGSGVAISTPFNGAALSSCRTPDHLLIHDQHAFARAVGYTMPNPIVKMMTEYSNQHDLEPVRYCRDADVLRDCFMEALGELDTTDRYATLEAIYKLLGIPCLNITVNGYSQGDWTDLLIVATPESQKLHYGETVRSPDEIAADMRHQAELYRAWAFGDCYGYVLERGELTDPEDEDSEIDWEELDSCWGYYGSDHAESGLAEAALECVKAEYLTTTTARELELA